MKKIDIILSIVIGEIIAWLFYTMLVSFSVGNNIALINLIFKISYLKIILAVGFPLLTIFGLWITWLIGKKFVFIFQFAKYALIGVFATVVDLGVMNFFKSLWSVTSTSNMFMVVKGISFIVSTLSKYAGDKFWAFEKMDKRGIGKEFGQFFLVTLVGLVINVYAAKFSIQLIHPLIQVSDVLLANIGSILAAVAAALWNFVAYKFIVFKK